MTGIGHKFTCTYLGIEVDDSRAFAKKFDI